MTIMKVMVLFNPVSGRGQSAAAAQDVEAALTSAGHTAVCTPTRMEPTPSWLDEALREVELAVIVGGDGAVRMAGAAAVRTGTPIYHFPCGTENLFAREFGMTRDPAILIRAIERWRIRRIDVGTANGLTFLLMLSIGYDAEVVHDLASTRGKSISHWTYLKPMLRQFLKWKPPVLSMEIDGQRVVNNQPGFVVVGNSREYGWRFNPVGRAVIDDGAIDVAFFPAHGKFGLLCWSIRCRFRRHFRHPKLVYVRGRQVALTSEHPRRFQVDGDPPEQLGTTSEGPWRLNIGIIPGAISVLEP